MRFPGFIGPTYALAGISYECQRCINLYPESNEMGTGKDKEMWTFVGTPGTNLLVSLSAGPVRGSYLTSTGVLYVVRGATLYSVNANWVATSIGSLSTGAGPVSLADNSFDLVIVDGQFGYHLTLGTTTLTKITDPNFYPADVVTYQDGYFIFNKSGTNKFFISDLNAITFTAPVISSKEGAPDNIISLRSINRNLWLFGDQTSEVWFDAGDNTNPFQYIQGTMMQFGCAAKFSVAETANTIFWLGKDSTGQGMVFMANGYAAQKVSTLAVDLAIQSYSIISDAIAYGYQENGHQFYVITFPNANASWCYDATTQLWHERGYNDNGNVVRLRANCYAYAYGTHVVGDYANGNLYSQSLSYYSDNGNPIIHRRRSPHISEDMTRVFYPKFQLDMEPGVGIDGGTQGTNPQAVLRWSDDGGHTWSNEHWASMGAIGKYEARAIWRRLGSSRNRVFEVTTSDPVKNVWIGAELDLMQGVS